jgi:peptide/histidine transporter 3/4
MASALEAEERDGYVSEPVPKRSTLLTVCPFILGNEFCERLAFYGLSTNLVIYLTRVMGEDSGFAAIQVNLFEGTCYLTPLLGAWVADSYLGRYKTILIFSVVYFVGMLMLAASAWVPGLTPQPDTYANALQNAALYTSLYIVALGTGGIKPNVSAFGADQFDEFDHRDRKEKKSFFNWFYFSINVGSLLAVTGIVWVQENVSWAIGFAIPAFAMAIAVLIFVAGSSRYKHVKPSESPFSRVFKVAAAALKENRRNRNRGYSALGANEEESVEEHLTQDESGVSRQVHRTASLPWLDSATQARGVGGVKKFTVNQVEEVKLVFRMLPIFFATIMYWTIYMQMGSFFVVQGSKMDRKINLPFEMGVFYIPAASLAVINTVAIVVLIPIYDRILVPLLKKAGRPMTMLRRIGWGLGICVLAMFMSATVEARRLKLFKEGKLIGDEGEGIVDMSVWYQIPQYLLIGASEIFTSIGQMEFFYDQAPDVMRSCSMALQLLSVCVGSYLSGALVLIIQSVTSAIDPKGYGWLPKNLNEGRLDLFLIVLGFLMALNLLHFIWVAVGYEYKMVEHVKRAAPGTRPQLPRPPIRPSVDHLDIPGRGRSQPYIEASSLTPAQYGRSVTFIPQTPVMPPQFR